MPAEEEPSAIPSELPIAIAERVMPEDPTLFIAARRTEPDEMKAYFTEDEIDPAIGWESWDRDMVIAALKLMPLELTLLPLAVLLKRLWGMGNSAREHLALATEIFGDAPVVREMARFCATEGCVVFSEQALFSLMSHAVVHCRDSDAKGFTSDERHVMLRLLLAAPSLLPGDTDLDAYDPDEPEEWLAYLTQNLLFNSRPNFGSGLARTWRIFGEIGRDPDREWKAPVSLRELSDQSDLTLEQQLAIAFGLYGIIQKDDVVAVLPEGWRDVAHRIAPDRDPDDVISPLSATPAEMRAALTSNPVTRLDPLLRWAPVPFLERPFLRLSDGRLLAVSPRALEAWPTDGVHYRFLRSAISRDSRTGAQHFTALAGEMTESYCVELIEAEHREAASRHLGIGGAHRAQALAGGETVDVLVVRGRDVVAIEISSSRVTAPTRLAGDLDALRRDMLMLVTKRVRQLDRTVQGLLSGTVELDGLAADQIGRIFPVVVNVEPVRWTPPLHAYLVREVPGLLQQPEVQPLQFVEIEDLEALLSTLGPPALADLVAAKLGSVGPDPDIQQWAFHDPAAPLLSRPSTVVKNLERSFAVTLNALGLDSDAAKGWLHSL